MAVKIFTAIADTTITNAFLDSAGFQTRATGANMGLADSLEMYSVYGRASSSFGSGQSAELSRILIKFPVTTADDSVNSIQAKRTSGEIPASGNVSFYLKMYNVAHADTLPLGAKVNVFAVSSSWEEGRGVDLDTYSDKTYDNVGANWINASASYAWSKPGGDYHTGSVAADLNSIIMYSETFPSGSEDLDVDVTHLVERWIRATSATNQDKWYHNHGIGVFLTASYEAHFSSSTGEDLPEIPPNPIHPGSLSSLSGGILHNPDGASNSYYTKKFSARSSEYFYKRPIIEARWDSSTKDDRGSFYYSSSLANPAENLNTIYFYNYFRGQLRNIPDVADGLIYVSFFSGNLDNTEPSGTALTLVDDKTHVNSANVHAVTGGYVSTGIYSASVCLTASSIPLSGVFDVWFKGDTHDHASSSTAVQYYTGSTKPIGKIQGSSIAPYTQYVSNIANLRRSYRTSEKARFRVHTRHKDWVPTIYSKASYDVVVNVPESSSYEIYRIIDDIRVISYGTGSDMHTRMSFDASGSYFDLDMGRFEAGYMYGIRLSYYNNSVGSWVEQAENFKFRIED
jgi:hypothetical protein|tara:strand:+ start:1470 stop:3176 length:1707 start_codon:yes stop_codon:yes gene_type:complete